MVRASKNHRGTEEHRAAQRFLKMVCTLVSLGLVSATIGKAV
jgi:hypothetical protein